MKISPNFDSHITALNIELDSHLAVFRSFLENVATTEFSNLRSKQSFVSFPVLPKNTDDLIIQETNKCFKSLIGSLQDFMDRMLAVLYVFGDNLQIIVTQELIDNKITIEQLILNKENEKFKEISQNTRLTTKDKVQILLKDDQELIDILNGYFSVRNSIEHNKGIAKESIDLVYNRLIIACDDKEITQSITVEAGQIISSKTVRETLSINEGESIKITEDVLDGILFTLKFYVAQKILNSVIVQINESKTAPLKKIPERKTFKIIQ